MAETGKELTQTVNVNLTGSGNLSDKAKDSQKSVDGLNKSVQATSGLVSAMAGSWGKFIAETQKANSLAGVMQAKWNQWADTQKKMSDLAALHASKPPSLQSYYDEQHRKMGEEARARSVREALRAKGMAVPYMQTEDAIAGRRSLSSVVGGAAPWAFGAGMGAIAGHGGMFSPWEMQRFDKAVRDLSASVGKDLVPWLQTATSTVRSLADAWLSLPEWTRKSIAGVIAMGTVIGGSVLVFNMVRTAFLSVAETATLAAAAASRLAVAQSAQATTASTAGSAGLLGGIGGKWRLGLAGAAVFGMMQTPEKNDSWIERKLINIGHVADELWTETGRRLYTSGDERDRIRRKAETDYEARNKKWGIAPQSSYGMAPQQAAIADVNSYLNTLQTDAFMSNVAVSFNDSVKRLGEAASALLSFAKHKADDAGAWWTSQPKDDEAEKKFPRA